MAMGKAPEKRRDSFSSEASIPVQDDSTLPVYQAVENVSEKATTQWTSEQWTSAILEKYVSS